jgi:hypothetical protein
MSDIVDQQPLINFLEAERLKRHLEPPEFAPLLGISVNQYYNLRNGKKSGPQQCIDLARALNVRPDYFLYLGGYIREDELDAPKEIPKELLPSIQNLARMRGTPFFDQALRMVESAIDVVSELFKIAA